MKKFKSGLKVQPTHLCYTGINGNLEGTEKEGRGCMNYHRERVIGLILLGIGSIFYLKNAIYQSGLLESVPHFASKNDFAHLYLGGYLAERGGDLYDFNLIWNAYNYLNIPTGLNPFVYPPFFGVVLIPLSFFSYEMAWLVFFVLSHGAFLWAISLLVSILKQPHQPRMMWWGILLGLAAVFDPLMKNYSAGQVNTFMLLVLCGGWYLYQNKKEMAAGMVLGLGAAIKITPVFMLFYFLWKKQWKAAVSGFGVIVFSVMLTWWHFGSEVHYSFLREVGEMAYGSSTWAEFGQHYHVEPHNQSPAAVWYRLLTDNPSTRGIVNAPTAAKVMCYFSGLVIGLGLLWYTWRHAATLNDYALWSLAMLLLPSLMWDHYLVQTILAIGVALQITLERDLERGLLLGIAIGLLSFSFIYDIPLLKEGWLTLLMAVKLAGLLLLAYYLLCLCREDAQEG